MAQNFPKPRGLRVPHPVHITVHMPAALRERLAKSCKAWDCYPDLNTFYLDLLEYALPIAEKEMAEGKKQRESKRGE